MNKLMNISNNTYEYEQYTDYIFKKTVQKYANGLLKFLNIPYKIHNMILSEIADKGPKLHRLDFAGEVMKDNEEICLILECQSRLPTKEDIKRFFSICILIEHFEKSENRIIYPLQRRCTVQYKRICPE